LRIALITNVARRTQALTGLGIDRDQRLVMNVVDGCEEFELTARESWLGSEETVVARLLAGAVESVFQALAIPGFDRPDQGLGPVAELNDLAGLAGDTVARYSTSLTSIPGSPGGTSPAAPIRLSTRTT
jgi:hypothetical protein